MAINLLSELLTAVASLGGGTINTNLFALTLPVSPVVCTVVQFTESPFSAANPMRQVGIQVLHRNTHVASGLSLANSIHAGLSNAWNLLPSITGRIQAVSEPNGYLYDDQTKWAYFPLRFVITTNRPY